MGIWGNPAATKKMFYSSWGAPAPGAPPLPTPVHVAADWHELMIPQRTMRSSAFCRCQALTSRNLQDLRGGKSMYVVKSSQRSKHTQAQCVSIVNTRISRKLTKRLIFTQFTSI